MLNQIKETVATITCDNCGTIGYLDLSEITCKFLPEFNEYENLYYICPSCESVTSYNMNLPLSELDDEIPTYEMPLEEEIQRYYVRLAMRMVREDLKQSPTK